MPHKSYNRTRPDCAHESNGVEKTYVRPTPPMVFKKLVVCNQRTRVPALRPQHLGSCSLAGQQFVHLTLQCLATDSIAHATIAHEAVLQHCNCICVQVRHNKISLHLGVSRVSEDWLNNLFTFFISGAKIVQGFELYVLQHINNANKPNFCKMEIAKVMVLRHQNVGFMCRMRR